MKQPFIEFLDSDYSQREWFWMRMLTGLAGMLAMLVPLIRFDDAPFPEGVCLVLPCQLVGIVAVKIVLMFLAIAAPLLYIIKPNAYSILVVSAVSVLVLTIQKTNGMHHRDELVSMVFIVQGTAYIIEKLRNPAIEDKNREQTFQRAIRYSVQIVAAAYLVSGLTKLGVAGIDWVMDSPNISLQIIKTYSDHTLTTGDREQMKLAEQKAGWVLEHQSLVRVMFLGAILTELFAFLAVVGRKVAFFYGILLMTMHVLVYYFLSVMLMVFVIMLFVYLFRLPGIIIWQIDRVKQPNESTA